MASLPEMRKALETLARKRARETKQPESLGREILAGLTHYLDHMRDRRRDRQTVAICYLIAETAHAVAYEDKDWADNSVYWAHFQKAVSQVLAGLAPPETPPPEHVPWIDTDNVARDAAAHVLRSYYRGEDEEDIAFLREINPRMADRLQLRSYDMAKARRDLKRKAAR